MTWPDPTATALDRARAIARGYRDTLARLDPATAATLDQAAARVGEGWVSGLTTGEQSCTIGQAALLLDVTERRVRQLIADGVIRSSGKARDGHVLLMADVQAYQRSRRVVAQRQASALPSAT